MQFLLKIDRYRLVRFGALIVLFGLLSFMGTEVYLHAGHLSSVKPFVGVGLALCLIYGRSWLWPVLVAGVIGGILAKLIDPVFLTDTVATPVVTVGSLLLTYLALRRVIGESVDFRSWKQMIIFIIVTAGVSWIVSVAFAVAIYFWLGTSVLPNLMSWFFPMALSYVTFTPLIVLLATAEYRVLRDHWLSLVVCLVLLAGILYLDVFRPDFPLLFTVPLVLLVTTMTSEIEGAALGLMVTQVILTTATVNGRGITMLAGWPMGYQIYFAQAFCGILNIVMLPVAAAITEPRKLRDGLMAALVREERVNQALRGAQRLEAVGKLTSGVAHDFNNLLTVILGNAADLEQRLAGKDELQALANLTKRAALRAADHTRQLLAFSRQQALDVQVRDVNELIASVATLLHLAVGERAEIAILSAPGSWPVLVDTAQFESALLNLAVNARDAMPNGGRVIVETRNIPSSEIARENQALVDLGEPGPLPRDYVLVAVSDTGTGMDENTRMQAFEPFFTTKEVGKGTGLGLSMVYGFITQLGGYVRIRSAPGHGTTIMLYLPRATDS
jgi:signal transduction histidine kinase